MKILCVYIMKEFCTKTKRINNAYQVQTQKKLHRILVNTIYLHFDDFVRYTSCFVQFDNAIFSTKHSRFRKVNHIYLHWTQFSASQNFRFMLRQIIFVQIQQFSASFFYTKISHRFLNIIFSDSLFFYFPSQIIT